MESNLCAVGQSPLYLLSMAQQMCPDEKQDLRPNIGQVWSYNYRRDNGYATQRCHKNGQIHADMIIMPIGTSNLGIFRSKEEITCPDLIVDSLNWYYKGERN